MNLRHSSSHDAGFSRGFHGGVILQTFLMNFVLDMNVDGVSQSENRSETDRSGLPHTAKTKHML